MASSSSEEFDPSSSLFSIQSSLSALGSSLDPLLAKPWDETLDSLPGGELDKAKMDILIAYAINDLVWVYLRMKGLDPSDHEVSDELERIKTYYAKIRKVEHPETRRTYQRTTGEVRGLTPGRSTVDKSAASRFIKSSLPKSQHLAPPSAEEAKRRAEEEAEMREMGHFNSDMSYMTNRWKHVAPSAEKISEQEAQGGGEGGLDDVELGDTSGAEDGAAEGVLDGMDVEEIKTLGGDAEDFLRELEDDLAGRQAAPPN